MFLQFIYKFFPKSKFYLKAEIMSSKPNLYFNYKKLEIGDNGEDCLKHKKTSILQQWLVKKCSVF